MESQLIEAESCRVLLFVKMTAMRGEITNIHIMY